MLFSMIVWTPTTVWVFIPLKNASVDAFLSFFCMNQSYKRK